MRVTVCAWNRLFFACVLQVGRHHDKLSVTNATFSNQVAGEVLNFRFLSLEERNF